MLTENSRKKLIIIDPVVHSVGNRVFTHFLANHLKGAFDITFVSTFGFNPAALAPQDVNHIRLADDTYGYHLIDRLYKAFPRLSLTGWGIYIFLFSMLVFGDLVRRRLLTGSEVIYLIDIDPFVALVFSPFIKQRMVLELSTNPALFQNARHLVQKRGGLKLIIHACRLVLNPFIKCYIHRQNICIASSEEFAEKFAGGPIEPAIVNIPVPINRVVPSPAAVSAMQRRLTANGVAPGDRIVLMFGINHLSKDYTTVFRSLAHVNGSTRFKLIVAGHQKFKNANDPYLLKRTYDRHDRVIILDIFFSEEDKAALYYCSDLALIALVGSFFYPSATLNDAIGAGTPVIAADTGFVGKTVRSGGIGRTYRCGDWRDLGAALSHFPDRASRDYADMSRNMETLCQRFSWQEIARTYIQHLTPGERVAE